MTIIEYFKINNIKGLVEKLRKRMDEELPFEQIDKASDHTLKWSFNTEHNHSSGENFKVQHIGCINDICFTQPHWRVVAIGADTEKWFNDGQKVGTGGIKNPTRVHLRLQHRYYRFTSSTSSEATQLGGGWWIEFDTLNTIKHFGERNSLEFTYAASLFLALPYDWSRMDRLVSAILVKPIDAYAGQGNVVKTNSDKWTLCRISLS